MGKYLLYDKYSQKILFLKEIKSPLLNKNHITDLMQIFFGKRKRNNSFQFLNNNCIYTLA